MPKPGHDKKGSASDPAPGPSPGGEMLNDVVYLLHKPRERQPDVELVFIHGLRFTDDKNMHWTTWLDLAGNVCWPAEWIGAEDFPVAARVLSIKYDSSAKKSATEGRFDLYSSGESLLQQMILPYASIGQNNCPVVFVCHSLGGLVAKSIVVTAEENFKSNPSAQALIRNLKGFFFYATPHRGSELFQKVCKVPAAKMGPLLKSLDELDTLTQRWNNEFQRRKNSEGHRNEWKFCVAAEASDTVLDNGKTIKGLPYASSKPTGIDNFVEIPDTNHFTVCRPKSKTSTSFTMLRQFVVDIHTAHPIVELQ